MKFDFAAERRRFPVLRERAFMASQCMGLFPEEMLLDLDRYRRSLFLRNRVIDEWVGEFEAMHGRIEELLHAPPGSVMLRDSATAAQAAIVAALPPPGQRKRIVISSSDFHSSRYLWQAQEARGFEVVEVDSSEERHADPESFAPHIDERTAIVALAHVSPRSGALLDVGRIAKLARDAGAIFIVDAYQSVGIVPIDVRSFGAHVVVGGTHKWLGSGGMGLAFGYVEPGLSEALRPAYPGWIGNRELLSFGDRFEPAAGALRFQQGTPALEPVYTARAGLAWTLEVGVSVLRARSQLLTQRILDEAAAHGIRARTPLRADARGGMVCLDVRGAKFIQSRLADQGFDVDERPNAGLRLGPHPCVTEVECTRVVQEIAVLRDAAARVE